MKELAFFGLVVITGGCFWLGSLLLVNARTVTDAYLIGILVGGIVWIGFGLACFGIHEG